MNANILFVDDDKNLLESFQRELEGKYSVHTAINGAEGLEVLQTRGPIAVVVADMRMPGMNGIEFLTKVREISPRTIRMMLTGNADMQTAIDAVNEGNIFRFLIKPCPPAVSNRALEAGVHMYDLEGSEQELLEKTLIGSIRMLTEILGIINPVALSRTSRVRRFVLHMVKELKIENGWQYELAATLSQIGYVLLPQDLQRKVETNKHLNLDDEKRLQIHPQIAKRMLEKIPRLELIARMVAGQLQERVEFDIDAEVKDDEYQVILGGLMLKVSLDFDAALEINNGSHEAAVSTMIRSGIHYQPELFEAICNMATKEIKGEIIQVKLDDLLPGMIVADHIWDSKSNMVVAKGTEITQGIITRIFSIARTPGAITGLIPVYIPSQTK